LCRYTKVIIGFCNYFYQFKFTDGDPRGRSLANFGWEKSAFSRKFKKAHTPKDFMAVWDRDVAPQLNANTGAYDDSEATPSSAELVDLAPKPKKAREDTEESMDKKIDAAYAGTKSVQHNIMYPHYHTTRTVGCRNLGCSVPST
jgi:hypothetical protein